MSALKHVGIENSAESSVKVFLTSKKCPYVSFSDAKPVSTKALLCSEILAKFSISRNLSFSSDPNLLCTTVSKTSVLTESPGLLAGFMNDSCDFTHFYLDFDCKTLNKTSVWKI